MIYPINLFGIISLKSENKSIDLGSLSCESLTGVGKRMAEKLSHLGILHVQDVLFHLPSRYQDRTRVYSIGDINPGEHVVIEGEVESVITPKIGRTRLYLRIKDATGYLHLRFFYVNSPQKNALQAGVKLRCFGEVRWGKQTLEMIHPEYYIVTAGMSLPVEEKLTPVYPATEGVSQRMLRKLTDQALVLLQKGGVLQELLPASVLHDLSYPSLREALEYVHRPPTDAPLDVLAEGRHASQKRLVFEELLAHRLSLLHLKKSFQIQHAIPLKHSDELINSFLNSLPFELTNAQKKVSLEIRDDLVKPHPMLRLVQGDVGSGKTAVAALAVLQAVANGYQAAILAPTELLVEQHFRTFQQWFAPLGIRVVMLASAMKVSERREVLSAISEFQAHVIVGTHAIFQKEVEFAKLALMVVDEQHRFGVEQRARLRDKGKYENEYPHQLIMTATPIPRTLAMSVYADLDYSVIDELPPGRTPVATSVISNTRRDEVLSRISDACNAGRQAYWVCTLIEESDVLQCKAAEKTAEELRVALPNLNIELLHGRMKSVDKDRIMQAFKSGEVNLLVATTVIEVGVDVPNASLMIIENAERLGLAQLHQLRGRVGRGSVASFCLLLYQLPLSQLAKSRLAVMRETTDGFKVAERDLALRGPGEVLGTRQAGDVLMRIADLVRDSHLLPDVQQIAAILEQDHPESVGILIRRWLGDKDRFGHV